MIAHAINNGLALAVAGSLDDSVADPDRGSSDLVSAMCHNAALVSPGRTRLALLASAALVAAMPAAASAQSEAPTASASATGITVDAKTGKTVPLLREVLVTGQLTQPRRPTRTCRSRSAPAAAT